MFFALEEVVNIFGKRYRHSTKYYYNIVREVLDRINCDNINCFKTSQQDAGQMVLDVVKEIEGFLAARDVEVAAIHGELSQSKRNQVMKRFQEAMDYFYSKHFKKSAFFSVFMKVGSFFFFFF